MLSPRHLIVPVTFSSPAQLTESGCYTADGTTEARESHSEHPHKLTSVKGQMFVLETSIKPHSSMPYDYALGVFQGTNQPSE